MFGSVTSRPQRKRIFNATSLLAGLLSSADKLKLDGIPFTKQFISADQVITAAGTLTLPHGMGIVPKLYACELVCQVSQGNWAVNDVVPTFLNGDNTNSMGFAITASDATNITGRYASTINTWTLIDKNTGARFNITVANWKMRLKAWG